MRMTKPLAQAMTGGLGNPSKMPGHSWGIPASTCQLGGVLKTQEGTQCAICYADRGRYRFDNVQDKLWAALELFNMHDDHDDLPLWSDAMAYLINDTGNRWFRWFHSGDLQSARMAHAIYEVCHRTPKVRHWLPTRERRHVAEALNTGWVKDSRGQPKNLAIRWSGTMVDGSPPKWGRLSSVISSGPHRHGRRCPAHSQGNACGDCRACWDQRVTVIEYETNNVH